MRKMTIWLPVALLVVSLMLSSCQTNKITNAVDVPAAETDDTEEMATTRQPLFPADHATIKDEDAIQISSEDTVAADARTDDEERSAGANRQDDSQTEDAARELGDAVETDADPDEQATDDHSDIAPGSTQTGTRPDDTAADDSGQSKLRLLGMEIGQPLREVTSRYGEPSSEYQMNEADGTFTVFEYDGFTFGFNERDQIEFIDVYAASINPSLNGVQVGSAASEAEQILGIPTERSPYVMTYRAGPVTMKVDLDPVHETILSIKLFPVE